MTCPQCLGEKLIRAAFKQIGIDCDMCNGKGSVPKEKLLDIKKGFALKKIRILKRLTLRDASKIYKIDATELSKMERGVIRPNMNIYAKKGL
jgi:hypothetical protein